MPRKLQAGHRISASDRPTFAVPCLTPRIIRGVTRLPFPRCECHPSSISKNLVIPHTPVRYI
jgi:hypothetical protein